MQLEDLLQGQLKPQAAANAWGAALEEHTGICAAIRERDAERASELMGAHVLRSGRLYLSAVFGKERTSP